MSKLLSEFSRMRWIGSLRWREKIEVLSESIDKRDEVRLLLWSMQELPKKMSKVKFDWKQFTAKIIVKLNKVRSF